jgi:hypothetical protein
MKRMTSEPWFGPRRLGWGWRPLNWQGWAATGVLVALLFGALRLTDRSKLGFLVAAAIIAVFGVFAWLTGGPPGGPTAFRRSK